MVAGLLADGGNIDPAYAESMLGREKVANTYLGEGIAIPHGLLKDREMIRKTGIAVVQVPGAVWSGIRASKCASWSASRPPRTSTCRSSRTSPRCSRTRTRSSGCRRLRIPRRSSTGSPAAPVTRRRIRVATMEHALLEGYASAEVVIAGASGLHARPATFFVDVAKGFGRTSGFATTGRSRTARASPRC